MLLLAPLAVGGAGVTTLVRAARLLHSTNQIQFGDYKVDEFDKEVMLENNAGDRFKFNFDGDDLELSDIEDGQRIVLKIERN